MKLIFPAAILIFIAVIAGAVAAPNFMDWQKHTDYLEGKVAGIAGMPGAKISGPIVIKTLPTPKIEIGRIELEPFQGDKKVAVIENFSTELSWSALWRLSLQPKYIRADSIEVNLVQMDENEANYLPKRQSRRISANAPRSLYPLGALGDVNIKKLSVSMENRQTDETNTVTADNITLSGANLSETKVNIAGMLNEVPFSINGNMDISSLRQVPVDLDFTLANSRLQLEGTAFDPFYDPMYTGKVSARFAELANPFTALGLKVPDLIKQSEKLTNITFKSNVMYNENEVSVNEIILQLNVPEDGSESEDSKNTLRETFEGNILYKYATGQTPADLTATLKGQNNDLGQFFGAFDGESGNKKTNEDWSDAPFDLTMLGGLTFDIRFNGQRTIYGGTTYDTVTLRLMNTNSTLTLEELTAEANGGTAKLSGVYNHASGNPEMKAKIRIRNMPLQSLMSGGLAKSITGELTGKFDVAARGVSEKELVSSLNGEGEVHITKGLLVGIKLKDTVTAVKKLFKRNAPDESTKFTNMSLTFTMKDGVLSNEDFYLHSEKAALKASGKIDFVNWTINARIRPQIETGVVDILVPVQVSGPLSGPAVVPVVTTSTGKAAAIGALLGGPIGAGIGAMIGSKVNKDNQAPEAPKDPLTQKEIEALEDKMEEQIENPLPFELENVSPDDVRKFLNGETE